MDLLVNDLSVHRQFHDMASFRNALSRLMTIRNAAKRSGRQLQCHREFLKAMPMSGISMPQAIGNLESDSERRAAMSWLTRAGPFWGDRRGHGKDDWLECEGNIATDTAIGEAAFRNLHGVDCGLVSLVPSGWTFAPIDVTWRRSEDACDDRRTAIRNW